MEQLASITNCDILNANTCLDIIFKRLSRRNKTEVFQEANLLYEFIEKVESLHVLDGAKTRGPKAKDTP